LASGREIDTKTKSIAGTEAWNNKTAAEMACYQGTRAKLEAESDEEYTRKNQNGPLIATLIDSYEQNPQQVRTQLRKELGIAETWLESQLGMSLSICSKCFPGETQDPTEITTLNLSDCGLTSLPDKIGLPFFSLPFLSSLPHRHVFVFCSLLCQGNLA